MIKISDQMFHEYQSELIQKSDKKVIIFVQIWSDLHWSMLVNTTPVIQGFVL